METHTRTRPLHDTRLGTVRTGTRHALGFGADFYGIWDELAPGTPIERFPATRDGRRQAWERYVDLEPAAKEQGVPFEDDTTARPPESRWTPRRWVVVGVVATAVVAVAGVVLGGGAGREGDGGAGAEEEATGQGNVQITGAHSATADLRPESLTVTGLDSLYPRLQATWTGDGVVTRFDINQVRLGRISTVENPHKRLEFVVTAEDGTEVVFRSVRGECVLELEQLEEGAVAGSFECDDLPAQASEDTIDVQGTFSGVPATS